MFPFKFGNDDAIDKSLAKTAIVNNKNLKRDCCVFNYNSLMNYIWLNESDILYLSESEQKTEPTEKFIVRICSFYLNKFKTNAFIDKNFAKCFKVNKSNCVGDVYGNIVVHMHCRHIDYACKQFC